jgi:hypothetical protein
MLRNAMYKSNKNLPGMSGIKVSATANCCDSDRLQGDPAHCTYIGGKGYSVERREIPVMPETRCWTVLGKTNRSRQLIEHVSDG